MAVYQSRDSQTHGLERAAAWLRAGASPIAAEQDDISTDVRRTSVQVPVRPLRFLLILAKRLRRQLRPLKPA
jgi:transcriptional regulator of met regulon